MSESVSARRRSALVARIWLTASASAPMPASATMITSELMSSAQLLGRSVSTNWPLAMSTTAQSAKLMAVAQ
ncbi:hypothetical protein D3C87_2159850 [compost metagenome]